MALASIGQCQALPRAKHPIEIQLANQLKCLPDELCVIHQGAGVSLIALAPDLLQQLSQLQFIWQQFSATLPLFIEQQPASDNSRASEPDINEGAVSHWLEQFLTDSIKQQASDIHWEPTPYGMTVRLRIAGQLVASNTLSPEHAKQVCARIKVLADLDITERRQPQDGRFSLTFADQTTQDFRVSCCPMVDGEKIVIRCLASQATLPPLPKLGLTTQQLAVTESALTSSQGFILVTGPTGSGKTSTLYTLIQRLDRQTANICTVEDPVEIRFSGINQVPVSERRKLTFATILRTLLRQDPDVLLVGEIRDAETAQVALQAAQTGHLVLASLHTNNAIDSLNRLQALGLPKAEVASALTLIISQRLLRKLCPHCLGRSCRHCTNGYFGQLPVFEVVPWSAQTSLTQCADDLASYLHRHQLPTLAEHAQQHVTAHLTSTSQAQRINYV